MTTRYDQVRYSHNAFFHTHPDRMAVIAKLFGLEAPAPDRCRVLELGVSSGANLIPMALRLPEATFYGIDLAAAAILDAQKAISDLGLQNITVEYRDILTLQDGFAEFDYIICHGVYSWVPADVRTRILSLCQSCLSPQGIAYISYNTFPGWHLFNVARDVMRLHGERFEDPMEQVDQGRAFIEFLAENLDKAGSPYAHTLHMCRDFLRQHASNYIYHDFFSPINVPFLFREFIEDAGRFGLQYLGESAFGEMFNTGLPDALKNTLETLSDDILSNEQYIDMVRCRTFRRTLLCRRSNTLLRGINANCLRGLSISAAIQASDCIEQEDGSINLKLADVNIGVHAPEAKIALKILLEIQPAALSFEALLAAIAERFPESRNDDAVSATLIHGFAQGAFHLFSKPPALCTQVSARPVADRWLRYQIACGENYSVNLYHIMTKLDRFDQEVLVLLDGSRDIADLEGCIRQLLHEGRLEVQSENPIQLSETEIQEAIQKVLQLRLSQWIQKGYLIAA